MGLDRLILGNSLGEWLIALAIAVLSYLGLVTFKIVVHRRLHKWALQTKTDVDDLVARMLGRTKRLFLVVCSVTIGTLVLELPYYEEALRSILVIGTLAQGGLWSNSLIDWAIKRRVREEHEERDAAGATMVTVLGFVFKVILWGAALLLVIDNIPGVELDTLLASLGVGGIAVALALQNILGDLLSSLSIALDRPIVIGDYITLGDYEGTVEHIGLKSTRVRSLVGEQIILSNSDLLSSRIRNYGRMKNRRVSFTLRVGRETPTDVLARIPAMIREAVESQQQTNFDRAHFQEFGEFSFDFVVVYHVATSDYDVYMDVQQAINLAILERFAEEGIELPYPTRMVLGPR